MCGISITVPALRINSPFMRSPPLCAIFSPCSTSLNIFTLPSSSAVFSTITTESAPIGIFAPVDILRAENGDLKDGGFSPILDSPLNLSITGLWSEAPSVSDARTANPSIVDLLNGGLSMFEKTSSEMILPRDSSVFILSVPSLM